MKFEPFIKIIKQNTQNKILNSLISKKKSKITILVSKISILRDKTEKNYQYQLQ